MQGGFKLDEEKSELFCRKVKTIFMLNHIFMWTHQMNKQATVGSVKDKAL